MKGIMAINADDNHSLITKAEPGVMKVFVSWSGSTSKQVAQALRHWLPYMIQAVEPFMSSGDISKGDTWSDVLANELHNAEYGIICVTPYNMSHPWLIFEAGAMSHYMGKSKVAPVLYRVSSSVLDHGPLSQFQSTDLACRDDFLRLISVLNRSGSIHRMEQELLESTFDHWWGELKNELDAIREDATETSTSYSWLRSLDDLHRLDLSSDCEVVWIVTQNVFKYVLSDTARKIIERNLDRPKRKPGDPAGEEGHQVGPFVKYRCMYPKSQSNSYESDLVGLRTTYGNAFDVCSIDYEEFIQSAPTDYVIFDYGSKQDPRAFVRAPVSGIDDYWFDAEPTASVAFKKRFEALWDRGTQHLVGVDAKRA
jgi:TIR domain